MIKMLPVPHFPAFLAEATAPASGSAGSPVTTLLFFGFIFAAMWFIMIAPQRKKQKEHQKMLAALGTGDEVITTGGIYGEITNVKQDRFVIRIADNTKVEVGKSFIQAVVKATASEQKSDKPAEAKAAK